MKIQIASDLHLDLLQHKFPEFRAVQPTDADVLVIAGDIHHHAQAIAAFRDWPAPVIYVHGNHELYDATPAKVVAELRKQSADTNVHYLERNEEVVNDVRFLGCCLWTDFNLMPDEREQAMQESDRCLMDYSKIAMEDGSGFSAADSVDLHIESLAWLTQKLDEPFDGKTVVVTHHAPHPDSIHPRFAGSLLNAAFITDLTPLIRKSQADLWIHGHVHDSFDYRLGKTRIIANPRGYARNRRAAQTSDELLWENPFFNPQLVAEL
jgi:Icc-related predicted phosphoesterase